MTSANPRHKNPLLNGGKERPESLIRRSWHAMSDIFSPFSPSALASLPNAERPQRYTRADAIPQTEQDEQGYRPTVRDYHAINSLPDQVRVPKKIATPVKVEGKVWFANERSEFFYSAMTDSGVSYILSLGLVAQSRCTAWGIGPRTFQRFEGSSRSKLCLCLCFNQYWGFGTSFSTYNVSLLTFSEDLLIRFVSTSYNQDSQKRSWSLWLALFSQLGIYLDSTYHPDELIGPMIVGGLLFLAILANFLIRGMFCRSFSASPF